MKHMMKLEDGITKSTFRKEFSFVYHVNWKQLVRFKTYLAKVITDPPASSTLSFFTTRRTTRLSNSVPSLFQTICNIIIQVSLVLCGLWFATIYSFYAFSSIHIRGFHKTFTVATAREIEGEGFKMFKRQKFLIFWYRKKKQISHQKILRIWPTIYERM